MDLTPTLDVLEAVYIIIVGSGWLLVLRGIIETRGDVAAIKARRINGARGLFAAFCLWLYIALFAAYTFMLGFGVQAATAPPPTDSGRSTLVAVLICIYMGLSLISTGSVVWAGRIYTRLLDLLEERARRRAERHEPREIDRVDDSAREGIETPPGQ